MTHGLSDEAIFRMRLDIIRLNNENRELRRRLGIPLDGRAVTLAVDNAVNNDAAVNSDVNTPVNADVTDRKAYMRDYMRAQRAAKKQQPTP